MIKITDDNLDDIKRNTQNGAKYVSRFSLKIKDEDDILVAEVEKVIYVRKNDIKKELI